MNAREMIEQEYAKAGGDVSRLVDPSPYDLAAERVIERLNAKCKEYNVQQTAFAKALDENERLRELLRSLANAIDEQTHNNSRVPYSMRVRVAIHNARAALKEEK